MSVVLRTSLLAAACGLLSSVPSAVAQSRWGIATDPPRALLDRTLEPRRFQLVSMTGSSITGVDDEGRAFTIATGDVLAILPPFEGTTDTPSQSAANPRVQPMLALRNGQVFPGRLAIDAAGNDRIAWDSPTWGRMPVPLDEVSSVLLSMRLPVTGPTLTVDRVYLTNADTAEGFVAGIGAVLTLERDKAATALPIDRVGAVSLANPPRPAEGALAWLSGGTVTGVESVVIQKDGAMIVTPGVPGVEGLPAYTGTSRDLRALLIDAKRVRGLAQIPWSRVQAAAGTFRRWTPPPITGDVVQSPLFAADIELPGPMSVEWDLPPEATRLSGIAELPASSRLWGDCTIEIAVAGEPPLFTARLNQATPAAPFNLELAGSSRARLRISIDPGTDGPVQDRVVLRRPMLLIGR